MCEITLLWEGGEHKFALPANEVRALEGATDAGLEELLQRMAAGRWRVDDLLNIIRFGLIGGGMAASKAAPLVKQAFDLSPLFAFKDPAYKIVAAKLVGVDGEAVWNQAADLKFALKIKEFRALQDITYAGPEELMNRIVAGHARYDDLLNPIRLGLIGAGMPESEAGPLVTKAFEAHPLSAFKKPAYEIVRDALSGVDGDPVGEQEGATTPPKNGNSAASTN